MNVKRMLKLADEIEHGDKQLKRRGVYFNMSEFVSTRNGYSARVESKFECGTTACIAGAACILFGKVGDPIVASLAGELLDLNQRQRARLFLNHDRYVSRSRHFVDLSKISALKAVRAIRRMVKEEGHDEIHVFGSLHSEFTDRLRIHRTMRMHVNDLPTRAAVLQWYLEFNAGGTPHTDAELNRVQALLDAEKSR